jgi:hypothetical protein
MLPEVGDGFCLRSALARHETADARGAEQTSTNATEYMSFDGTLRSRVRENRKTEEARRETLNLSSTYGHEGGKQSTLNQGKVLARLMGTSPDDIDAATEEDLRAVVGMDLAFTYGSHVRANFISAARARGEEGSDVEIANRQNAQNSRSGHGEGDAALGRLQKGEEAKKSDAKKTQGKGEYVAWRSQKRR